MGCSTVVTEPCPYYVVATTMSGKALLTAAGNTRAIPHLNHAVIAPGDLLRVNYLAGANEMMTIVFDPVALEDELTALLGRAVSSPIRFYDTPQRSGGPSPFHRVLSLLGQELTDSSVIVGRPQMSSYYARLLMASQLLDHRHNYSEELSRLAASPDRERCEALQTLSMRTQWLSHR
jgi:hypothetical protein